MKKKREKLFFKFINGGAFSTLIGVIIGGLIAGYFSYQTQKLTIENQKKEFSSQYLIKKNNELTELLSEFLEHFYRLNLTDESELNKRKEILNKMNLVSMKISLLNNYIIGTNCSDLTSSIENYINEGLVNDKEMSDLISKWSFNIKAEMKKIDYSVDRNQLKFDIIETLIKE
ncbi:hypothetical protein [Thalassobellus citreus]|uniref:hypothetical protein n=1 Tax=Thalassobellus citreus TaxID=3367752 RepID=UPI003794FCE8